MATSMEHVVAGILSAADIESKLFSSIAVSKDIDVDIDLGNLLVCDPNQLNSNELRSGRANYLLNLARDNAQLLINKLWELPSERSEDVVIVKLPRPTTRIPREKPVPAPKKPTRWETFSKMKGIVKKKKERMVYDEQKKEWLPRWGYKRANDNTTDWLIPVPDQADPNEDQFEKRLKAKKERTAKNELQRLRNLARNMKGKVPGVGLTPTSNPDKDHIQVALAAAKTSNASMGQFTDTLAKEKKVKAGKIGKKRKFESNYDSTGAEKRRALDILSKLSDDQPIVDKVKAANLRTSLSERRDNDNEDYSSGRMGGGRGSGRGRGGGDKHFKKRGGSGGRGGGDRRGGGRGGGGRDSSRGGGWSGGGGGDWSGRGDREGGEDRRGGRGGGGKRRVPRDAGGGGKGGSSFRGGKSFGRGGGGRGGGGGKGRGGRGGKR